MVALASIEIDADPVNIAAMMEVGALHSHQDGRWRYSRYGGETAYVNDPTVSFEDRAEFAGGRAAAVCRSLGLIATIYGDGTRSITTWRGDIQPVLWQIYGAKDPGEREQRDWIAAHFMREAA